MAFELPIAAADGRDIEGAYWVPTQIVITPSDMGGRLTFSGYLSREARDAGKAPIAGASRTYPFSPEQFEAAQALLISTLFPGGIPTNATMYDVLARFAYSVALARKDVQNPDGTLRSFFEAAQDV